MYRVGIVGVGGISQKHEASIRKSPHFELAGIADIDKERLSARAKEWNVQAFESNEALIGSDIDVVVICTPPGARREIIELACSYGKHILCEKPLALNVAEGQHLFNLVTKSGLVFMSGFNPLYDPVMRTALETVSAGVLGDLVHVRLKQHVYRTASDWQNRIAACPWRKTFAESGGRIQEYGSHAVSWLLKLGGAARSVHGQRWTLSQAFVIDDSDALFLHYESGAVAFYELVMAPMVKSNTEFQIFGTKGSLYYDGQSKALDLIEAGEAPKPIIRTIEPESRSQQYEDLANAIRSGKQPTEGIQAAFETLAVCETFNASTKSGCEVPVPGLPQKEAS